MIVKDIKPFQLSTYNKSNIPPESKLVLLSSYSCVSSPVVVMAGTVIDRKVILCKKTPNGHLNIQGNVIKTEKASMTLENLIQNFKESEGVDFMVIDLQPYFLVTRQENQEVNIFMTTSKAYTEMFVNPQNVFGTHPENTVNYGSIFKPKKSNIKKEKLERKEITEEGVSSSKEKNEEFVTETECEGRIENSGMENKMEEESKMEEDVYPSKETINPQMENDVYSSSQASMSQTQTPSQKKLGHFQVDLEERLSDEDFFKILEKESNLIAIKYGSLRNGTIEFVRQPFRRTDNEDLIDLFRYFNKGPYDFVEIQGKTHFSGVKEKNEFVWFAQLPSFPKEEHCYIIEVTKILRNAMLTPKGNK